MTAFLQANMPDKYVTFPNVTVANGSTYAANEFDIEAAFAAQYGDARPAVTLQITTDKAIDVRFNDITGNVWPIAAGTEILNRGELLVSKVFIDNSNIDDSYGYSQSYANDDAIVTIKATG